MKTALSSSALILMATGWTASAPALGQPATQPAGAVLYNGIRLPAPWPPKYDQLPPDPMPVPYLSAPPSVIPIDVGRQLFVDNFLIEQTTLQRTFHAASYIDANPVLKPDRPWEQTGNDHTAMPFSDGAWYDPADKLFKMWYMGGYLQTTCYATSRDGVKWDKPNLDVVPGTNIVQKLVRDSNVVWLDLREKDPSRRYKMVVYPYDKAVMLVYFSPDGIHWGEPIATSGPCGDRTTAFFNPFRDVWVMSIRASDSLGGSGHAVRSRRYHEGPDILTAARWRKEDPVIWTGPDRLDPRRADLNTQPELYNLDCVAYESVLLGLFSMWPGQPKDRPKPDFVVAGFSRDGFHWDRPNRKPFIDVSERYGDWNWGNVQSTGGGCLIVGDKLYFYVSGRAGVPGASRSGVCSTGLATLRRDGFASMDAATAPGTLTTRPVRFSGKHLFINADVSAGNLRVEILAENGTAIAPFTADNCVPVKADSTRQAITWRGVDDLAPLAGKSVRFRFHLTSGKLYSFWVSPTPAGASQGYTAAGGPGLPGLVDTVGGAVH